MTQGTVALTGATGFLGVHVAEALAAAGARLKILARPSSDVTRVAALNPDVVPGGLEDADALARLADGAAAFVHVAGLVHAPSYDAYARVNVEGARAAARAAAAAGVETFVLVSSLAAAGPTPEGAPPRREDDPPEPRSAYGRSKRDAEDAVLAEAARVPRVVIFRPGAIYGPWDRAFLPYFAMVRRGLRPVIGDGRRTFQVVHARDVARAIPLALGAPRRPRAYFLVPRAPETWESFGRAVEAAVGRRALRLRLPEWIVQPSVLAALPLPAADKDRMRDFAAQRWDADPSRAEAELGWRPKIPLAEGLRETWRWYRAKRWA